MYGILGVMNRQEETTNADLETVKEFLATARITEVRNTTQGATIHLGKYSTEIVIRRGVDGRWRYVHHSTYGNGSFVWSGDVNDPNGGGQYDASGYRIVDPQVISQLDDILRVRGIR